MQKTCANNGCLTEIAEYVGGRNTARKVAGKTELHKKGC